MPVAEFPLPSVLGTNPIPSFFEIQPEEFVVGRTLYDDGGADYKLQSGGNGKKAWIVRYNVLTAAQAAVLISWAATTFYSPDEGSAWGFNFRDRDTAVLYTNCHIAPGGYKKSHTKTWIWNFEFLIEKRP